MSPEAWLLLGTLITAVGGIAGTTLLIRQQGRQTHTTDAQQLIDQLQEERKADDDRHERQLQQVRSELAEVRGELRDARRDVALVRERMDDRERVLLDYVALLRAHIDQGLRPPPPPWPSALMHHRNRLPPQTEES